MGSATPTLAGFHGPVPAADGRPRVVVHGNCQAESLRIVLGDAVASVRLPPVHELAAGDLPHLERWLAWADALVSQPVRRGYRGLALGTGELAGALRPEAALVLVPVIRFAGLYPDQVIVRPPHDPAAVPPLVPYHSLRTLLRAAGHRAPTLRAPAVRAIAADSVRELAEREHRHGTVTVSDAFATPSFTQMRTINHPGNPIWHTLAQRTLAALALDATPTDPGRPLLDAIHAPREAVVHEALGLAGEPDPDWRVDGRRFPVAEVADAHLAWYARHPETVAAGLRRHAGALARLRAA